METVTTGDCGRLAEPEYLLGSREFVAHGWLGTTAGHRGKKHLYFTLCYTHLTFWLRTSHFLLVTSHFLLHKSHCQITL